MIAQKLGFVGLGVMGSPMAGHLAAAGHELFVFDIDRSKADALADLHESVIVASNPQEVASHADIVMTMLPSGEYVRDVVLGEDGLIAGFSGGELLVDTSSCEPWLTLETAAKLAECSVAMVDAPTSGAEMGAVAANLVFMAGGSDSDLERARMVLDHMGEKVFHLGPLGAGHSMKSINNLITAMTFLATAEGLALGTRMGLDPGVMTDVLNACTGMSWITRTHFKQRIINRAFDDPFKLELMVKDIRIALGLAGQEDVPMPLSNVGEQLFELADEAAGPGASVSELVRFVEQAAGVEIRQTSR